MKRTVMAGAMAAVLGLAAGMARAENWPRLRGARGDGISADTRVPTRWSEKENLRWKRALPGPGSSSPIVWGDKVFVTCYSGYGTDRRNPGTPSNLKRHLLCLDRATGKELWQKITPAKMPEDNYRGYLTEHGYASNTPTTDGERVYVFYGKTGVLAYDMAGKELWRREVGGMSSNRRWGSAASVMLHGGKLIVNAAEEGRAVLALDPKTGKEIWRAAGDALELSFNTPLATDAGGKEILLVAVPGELWALNPETGKLRWYAETNVSGNVTPSVTLVGKLAVVTGGWPRMRTTAVRLGGKSDVTSTHRAWTTSDASYVATPVLHGGRLYWIDDRGTAQCLAADTGKSVYKHKLDNVRGGGSSGRKFYASPLLIGGTIYAVSRRSGTFVYAPGSEFKVRAINVLASDGSDFNAAPAVSKGQLFLRSDKAVYCIGAK